MNPFGTGRGRAAVLTAGALIATGLLWPSDPEHAPPGADDAPGAAHPTAGNGDTPGSSSVLALADDPNDLTRQVLTVPPATGSPPAEPALEDVRKFHENGVLRAKGQNLNGQPVGYWVHYHENGTIEQEGSFDASGQPAGPWTYRDGNGHIELDLRFDAGEVVYTVQYDPVTGQLVSEEERAGFDPRDHPQALVHLVNQGEYDADLLNDRYTSRIHDNGTMAAQGKLVGGKQEGYWSYWHENGAPDNERTGYYEKVCGSKIELDRRYTRLESHSR